MNKNKALGVILLLTTILMFFGPIIWFLSLYFNWTDGNIEHLIYLIKGKNVDISFWLSSLIAVIGSGATLVFNIIMEIIKSCG